MKDGVRVYTNQMFCLVSRSRDKQAPKLFLLYYSTNLLSNLDCNLNKALATKYNSTRSTVIAHVPREKYRVWCNVCLLDSKHVVFIV